MRHWHDITKCTACGYTIAGLPVTDQNETLCPECAHRSDRRKERSERLAGIRRRDRRQLRVLVFLAVLLVSAMLVVGGALIVTGFFAAL